MGKDTWPRDRLEEPVTIAKLEAAGEVTDSGRLAGLLDDIGNSVAPRLTRPHADRLARGGELLVEPGVVGVVDRRHEMPPKDQSLQSLLEDLAGKLGLTASGKRNEGQVKRACGHVGLAGR